MGLGFRLGSRVYCFVKWNISRCRDEVWRPSSKSRFHKRPIQKDVLSPLQDRLREGSGFRACSKPTNLLLESVIGVCDRLLEPKPPNGPKQVPIVFVWPQCNSQGLGIKSQDSDLRDSRPPNSGLWRGPSWFSCRALERSHAAGHKEI